MKKLKLRGWHWSRQKEVDKAVESLSEIEKVGAQPHCENERLGYPEPSFTYCDQDFPQSWSNELLQGMDENTCLLIMQIGKNEKALAAQKSFTQRPQKHLVESLARRAERVMEAMVEDSNVQSDSASLKSDPILIMPIQARLPESTESDHSKEESGSIVPFAVSESTLPSESIPPVTQMESLSKDDDENVVYPSFNYFDEVFTQTWDSAKARGVVDHESFDCILSIF